MKFYRLVASWYPHIFANFSRCILIFHKNGVNYSRSTNRISHFKFRVSASQIALIDFTPMMSGQNSPDLSPLDYQLWGQCWSLISHKLQQKPETVPGFNNALQLIWSTGESHWQLSERLPQATAGICQWFGVNMSFSDYDRTLLEICTFLKIMEQK